MITHKKQCNIADNESDNPDIVNPSDWNDTHDVDVDALNALIGSVLDLGDISGAITVDLSYSAIKFNLTGNATFTFTNPPASGVNRPTTFYGTRTSGSNAVLSFAQSVSWVGTLITPAIIDVQTTVFSVSTINAGTSYFGFANGVVIETTASGQATTWNPSDFAGNPPLTLTNSNRTIEMTTATGSLVYRSARAFGGKQTGKWYFSVRCDASVVGATGAQVGLAIGVGVAGIALTAQVGAVANSACWVVNRSASLGSGTTDEGTFTARTAYNPLVNDIFTILMDFATGNGWVMLNNTVLYSGNPETGANPAFNLTVGNIYFPMISLAEQSTANAGIWTLLNEVQSSHVPIVAPSYRCWTA